MIAPARLAAYEGTDAAVLLAVTLVFYSGIGPALGVTSLLSLSPPDVYRPLVWGGLWGIPLAFILRSLKGRHKVVGFLYFLAPVVALLLVVGFGMVLVTYSGSLWFSGLHAYSGL